jgi:hypothetical protein
VAFSVIVSGFITRLVFGKPERGISHLNPLAEKILDALSQLLKPTAYSRLRCWNNCRLPWYFLWQQWRFIGIRYVCFLLNVLAF